jgi:hypothetical protein
MLGQNISHVKKLRIAKIDKLKLQSILLVLQLELVQLILL